MASQIVHETSITWVYYRFMHPHGRFLASHLQRLHHVELRSKGRSAMPTHLDHNVMKECVPRRFPPLGLVRLVALAAVVACTRGGSAPSGTLLALVNDVPLPGGATRFDYQEIDSAHDQLVVAHMNDDAVLVLALSDGSVRKVLPNIPTPRGVAIGDGKIFVTSKPSQLVIIDGTTLAEITRVTTGRSPDGDAFDPDDKIVGVSDQGDGALSLIANSGTGTRTPVALGSETGNVAYDPMRKQFWITVVKSSPPDQLVEVDPKTATVTTSIP